MDPLNNAGVKKPERRTSYGQILKSSAIVGGSSIVGIAIGIVRTKAMALLLGPAGFGLMGIYSSILDLGRNVSGLGVNSSGVRQIADAVGSEDSTRIARTAMVLRRVSVILGLLGGVAIAALSVPISRLSFSSDAMAIQVALLGVAVWLWVVSDGRAALIQGVRRIRDLAAIHILGALFGTVSGIVLVYFLREAGVVPALIAVAASSMVIAWWFSRRVVLEKASLSLADVRHETAGLLKLGLAFMGSAMLTLGAAYVIRIIVLRTIDLDAAGFYQSAWALGGLYIGLILQSMGADFYPRLTAVSRDDMECNRLVNEQALVSLLMAGPGVIATLAFAPLVIAVFYSPEFVDAVGVLRWICLGMSLRMITWPMGFIIVARGEQTVFFLTELAYTAVHVGFGYLCVRHMGLAGAGVAFFISYVFHWLMIYPVVRRMSGFRWAPQNFRIMWLYLSAIAVVFACCRYLSPWVSMSVGLGMSLISGVYSIRIILTLIPVDRRPPRLQRLLQSIGLGGRSGIDDQGRPE